MSDAQATETRWRVARRAGRGARGRCRGPTIALVLALVLGVGPSATLLTAASAAVRQATPDPDRSTDVDDGTGGPTTQATPPTESTPVAAASPAVPEEESVRIAEIQGAGHRSPHEGTHVVTTGVVTALRADGFYLQDPEPDDDPATAEGLFVLTTGAAEAPALAVGDAVVVAGTVVEWRAGSPNNLSRTQLEAPVVVIEGRGAALPASVRIGLGGREPSPAILPPTGGDVETAATFDPERDALAFWESLEGMLVAVDGAVVVGPRRAGTGEIVVLLGGGAADGRTARGGLLLRPDDPNPGRIFLDDEVLTFAGGRTPSVDVGDRFPYPLLGVVDYGPAGAGITDATYKIQLTATPTIERGGLATQTAPPAAPGELTAATLNLRNLGPEATDQRYAALAALIVTNLAAPDLLDAQELQDANGPGDDPAAVVDAAPVVDRLIEAISAAGGPIYAWEDVPPVWGQDGGAAGANIRTVVFFRTDRGLNLAEAPTGDAVTPVAVVAGAEGPHLSHNPGLIDPGDPSFRGNRKPLAVEFVFDGRPLFVLGLHLLSPLGDDPPFGRVQPPAANTAEKRLAQAEVIAAFVEGLLAVDPTAHVVVLGDFNAPEWSPSAARLVTAGLLNLVAELPAGERYTTIAGGNAQTTALIFVSPALAAAIPVADAGGGDGFAIIHAAAEFSGAPTDHDPPLVRFAFGSAAPPATPTPG